MRKIGELFLTGAKKTEGGGDLLKKIQATVEWFLGLTSGLENGSAMAHTRQTLVLAALALRQRKRGHLFLGNPLAFFLVELEGIEPTTS